MAEIIVLDDRIEYRLDGQRHKVDGPAIEWEDGTKMWYLLGRLHRMDGPAIEWGNGTEEWWVNGHPYRVTKESCCTIV